MDNSTGPFPFFFNIKSQNVRPVQTGIPPKRKERPVLIPSNPDSNRYLVNFLLGCLIFGLIGWIIIDPGILSISSMSALLTGPLPTSIPAATTTPVNTVNAKDLQAMSYGDYLQPGQTNFYYFDVSSFESSNYRLMKVFAQAKQGHLLTTTVGLNYVPMVENNRYDYIASTSMTSQDAVIQINNPSPGRYFVSVQGVSGNGDTRVSLSKY
jgi:hypothetical protein